ncbi:hypothetical protein MPLDJ20_140310 [Mesorhizobium plurifarium]|uniref:Uncharacterized protein n=1 Tax=Mesorhizobium plurifarium TaxID=69974 RepID=A0A090ERE4_MESPL|nr:hypothetical protein MPLDJ20_140310 [Mesorhizobium plurifarium]
MSRGWTVNNYGNSPVKIGIHAY